MFYIFNRVSIVYEPPLTLYLNSVNYMYLVMLWFVFLHCLKDL
jgi:hypothetical protein